MSIDLLSLSASKLQKVISLKRKIERLQYQLTGIVGATGTSTDDSATDGRRKRRNMSPEARARIAAAAKARWAKYRENRK